MIGQTNRQTNRDYIDNIDNNNVKKDDKKWIQNLLVFFSILS